MKKFHLLILALIFFACEKSLTNFELDNKPRKQVVNAFFGNDSLLTVHVSYSSSIMQPDILQVNKNASVNILQNNGTIHTLEPIELGFYRASEIFQHPSENYELVVKTPNFPDAKATLEFPSVANILKTDTSWYRHTYDASNDSYDLENLQFDITIVDPDDSRSYFLIELIAERYEYFLDENENLDSLIRLTPMYIETNDQSAIISVTGTWASERNVGDEQTLYGTGFVFSDEYFSGDRLTYSIEAGYWEFDTRKPFDRVYVSVKHISEPYYLFLKSFALYDQSIYNPFAQKVNVYSNIEGGFGIVGTYSINTQLLHVTLRERKTPTPYY